MDQNNTNSGYNVGWSYGYHIPKYISQKIAILILTFVGKLNLKLK